LRSLVAGLVFAFGINAVAAETLAGTSPRTSPETWPTPRVTTFKPDWKAAQGALPLLPRQSANNAALADLTVIAAEVFPAVAQSPVPVLLPFAIADYAYDRAADTASSLEAYASDFQPTKFFLSGPTGYDATFSLRMRDVAAFGDIGFADPVVVQISAFNLLYELPEAKGAIILKPGELDAEFPGIKRKILESTLRYSFERFDIPYVVSIQCFDGPQRRTRLSCRNADRIAARFLRALRLVGGHFTADTDTNASASVTRPAAQSDVFSYRPVGKLLAGTAMRAQTGDADKTVYARMRFPAALAPAYVNSQKFRRRSGSKEPAPTDHPNDNAGYVWQDNFCERRDFFVGQCPSGRGHQGQDIRGVTCDPKNNKVDCRPYRDDVVASRNGMILRETWNDSFFLVTNEAGARLRFRHLHMHPRKLDADNIFSGQVVKEGDRLGTIGNYSRRPGLTTTHLHFEIQVPTRDGWVRINPYLSLVASYEHLIGARGVELRDAVPPADSQPSDSGAALVPPAIAASATLDDQPKVIKTRGKSRAKGGRHVLKGRGKRR